MLLRTSVTPASLLVDQADEFLRHLPGVRDGDADAIHDARVATRRIRELIPLVAAHFTPSDLEHLDAVVRKATRRLGQARDVDVALASLASVETALPDAVADVAVARTRWLALRDKRVKRAIKALERLEVAQVLREASANLRSGRAAFSAVRRRASSAGGWEGLLATRLRERAGALASALDHAGGVLFPNRLHATRIALKKLRYAAEISIATGHASLEALLPPMRKAQELLGRLHDLDVLAAALHSDGGSRVVPLVDFQRRRLHQRYLSRRPALIDACATAVRAAGRQHRGALVRRTALAASLPLALLAVPMIKNRA